MAGLAGRDKARRGKARRLPEMNGRACMESQLEHPGPLEEPRASARPTRTPEPPRYVWGTSYHGSRGVSPQAAGHRLAQLDRASARRLTPRQVVDDARDPATVLHGCFEWDDVRAAELHREQQARHVIASLRVITPTTAMTPAVQRVYVSVVETHGDETERSYRPLSVVREDPVQRDAVLDEARRGLEAWRARYENLVDATTIQSLLREAAE